MSEKQDQSAPEELGKNIAVFIQIISGHFVFRRAFSAQSFYIRVTLFVIHVVQFI